MIHFTLILIIGKGELLLDINFFLAGGDLSSADNLCKQFGPRSGLTELFDSLIVSLKEFFEKVNFEKSQQTTTKT